MLKRWIEEGAQFSGHWAFQKPKRPTLPKIKNRTWAKNAIDSFIAAKLEENKLKPSPQADRYELIRRLSLDLTGLPPTPTEVTEFVNDRSPNAYEKVVDGLLASRSFGEKWARMWLDIARYADSAGYGSDPLRLNIWPYRDWVINAFNTNMSFDQFTIEQIAGDLLENPNEDQLIASAFNRNTMTNTEGGTDDEEWRVAAVKDRANVTMQAWMGLTMGCAQCHTHKFDPITQREYYQFYAIFNQTEDNDQPDERPTLPLPTPEEKKKIDDLKQRIAVAEKKLSSTSPDFLAELKQWEKSNFSAATWTTLEPLTLKSENGATLKKLDDNSVLASEKMPEKDAYTVELKLQATNANVIRLDVLTDDSLPNHGPGRNKSGNFVLNEFRATLKPEKDEPKIGRFVRIELPGAEKILSLAEVQVFSGKTNIAKSGKATQSSVDFEGPPNLAIDGKTDGDFNRAKSTTHTKSEANPWWEVDLGTNVRIDSIAVWNRTDSTVGDRLTGALVRVLDAEKKELWSSKIVSAPKESARFMLAGEQEVRFRRVTATFSEKNYDISLAIDGKEQKKSGWSLSGAEGKSHNALFELEGDLPAGTLTVNLVQNYGMKDTIGRFRISVARLQPPLVAIPSDISALLEISADKRTSEQQDQVLKWFGQHASSTGALRNEIADLNRQIEAIKPLGVPVMRELKADQRRTTHILVKGNFLTPGDEVGPGIPAAFHAFPAGAPTNRLGVAKWLISDENPLTARVAANRIWSQLFGTGLVETEEDFGTQGTLPSHPQLLDWLAMEFMQGNQSSGSSKAGKWDTKHLIKTIVMSATYQQTSRVTPELIAKDPRNRLLSRAPRRRLDAELVRDQALALSGLLSSKIGGPSVYPPQPDGLWRAAFNGQRTYPTSMGEDRYRRGLYTIWRRTVPYPSMNTFDAPSRETCTFRRLPTNTPLQAFVTLNDPVYVECAQALGRRLMREGGATLEEKLSFGLRLVLARPVDKKLIVELQNLYSAELEHYTKESEDAVKLATNPIGALPANVSAAEAAAWTVVANVLLNLDGVLTKG